MSFSRYPGAKGFSVVGGQECGTGGHEGVRCVVCGRERGWHSRVSFLNEKSLPGGQALSLFPLKFSISSWWSNRAKYLWDFWFVSGLECGALLWWVGAGVDRFWPHSK